jgi:hypothetical protein
LGFELVDRFRVWANVAGDNNRTVLRTNIVRVKMFLLVAPDVFSEPKAVIVYSQVAARPLIRFSLTLSLRNRARVAWLGLLP